MREAAELGHYGGVDGSPGCFVGGAVRPIGASLREPQEGCDDGVAGAEMAAVLPVVGGAT